MDSLSHNVKLFRNYNFTFHSNNSAYPEMEIEKNLQVLKKENWVLCNLMDLLMK